MASTFTATTTAQSQPWIVIVRISGFGTSDTQYSLCTDVPSYASATYYLPYLTAIPKLESESLPPFGGISLPGSLKFDVLDYGSFLSSQVRLNALPLSYITADNTTIDDATSVIYSVPDATLFTVGSYYFMGGECIKCTAKSGTSLTVDREKRGTEQEPHFIGDAIYSSLAFLSARKITCYLVPRDASSASEEKLLGTFTVSSVSISPLNVWTFSCTSKLHALHAYVATDTGGKFINTDVLNGKPYFMEHPQYPPTGDRDSGGVLGSRDGYYISDGEGIGFLTDDSSETLIDTDVGFAFAGRIGQEDEVYRVAVAKPLGTYHYLSSFRYSPGQALIGANPSTADHTSSGTWEYTAHPVDILLNILTSPRNANDPATRSTNYANAYGNWAVLPPGMGLGLWMDEIDVASFLDVKARTQSLQCTGFVLGHEKVSFSSLATEQLLAGIGAYLTRDYTTGLISLKLLRQYNAGETVTEITTDDIIADAIPTVKILDANAAIQMVGTGIEVELNSVTPLSRQVSLLGQVTETVSINAGGFGPGVSGLYSLTQCAQRHNVTGGGIRVAFELSLTMDSWGLLAGDIVLLTLPGIVNPLTGSTFSSSPFVVTECAPSLDPYPHLEVMLVSFGEITRPLIGASAEVSSSSITGGNATLTLLPYTFCVRYNTEEGVPATDVAGFSVGDVIDLVDETDGTTATSSNYGTITAINTGANTITVSGTFGGMTTGAMNVCVAVPAPYASAVTAQKNRIAYIGDAGDNTINGSGSAWRLGLM